MQRLLLAALVLSGACATPRQHARGANTAYGSDDDMICSEVADTGTLFSHTECKPRREADDERDGTRRFLQRSLPAHGTPGQPGPQPGHI